MFKAFLVERQNMKFCVKSFSMELHNQRYIFLVFYEEYHTKYMA